MTDKAFQDLLLEAIDSALASLGDSAKQSVYYHLQKEFNVSRNEIPDRIGDFDSGLEQIFGAGTRFLEVMVMKKLYEEMGSKGKILTLDINKEFNFIDYVKAAQTTYEKKKKT